MVFLLAFSIHEEREDVNNLSYQYKEMFLNPRGMGTKKPPWGGWRVVLGLWFRLCSCQSVELVIINGNTVCAFALYVIVSVIHGRGLVYITEEIVYCLCN